MVGYGQQRLRPAGLSGCESHAAFDDRLSTATSFDDRRKAFYLHQTPLALSDDHQTRRRRDAKTCLNVRQARVADTWQGNDGFTDFGT